MKAKAIGLLNVVTVTGVALCGCASYPNVDPIRETLSSFLSVDNTELSPSLRTQIILDLTTRLSVDAVHPHIHNDNRGK